MRLVNMRWGVGSLLLLMLVVTGGLVMAIVLIRPTDVRFHCAAADAPLAAVLDVEYPAVRSACGRESEFMAALRDEIGRNLADQHELWRQGLDAADTEEALELWLEGRLIALPGGPDWSVPTRPDWSEDPYQNISWMAGYQSLGWLAALARGYRQGDAALGEELGRYVLSWIENNTTDDPPSVRSWYDGAVHRRTNTIVAVMDVLLDVLDDEDLETVLISLHEHGARLNSYLTHERFYGHNHNLFHSLALMNLTRSIPVLDGAAVWQEDARGRMHTLLREMVNPEDGVSTEQASTYHVLAMDLFASARRYLAGVGDDLRSEDLSLLGEMTRFGALLPDPAGTLPAIGDSPFGSTDARAMAVLQEYADLGLASPESLFVLSRGEIGRRPADAVFFEGEGYGIFRTSYGDDGAWADDLHMVVDMGPSARVHGHHDAMNVLLAWGGEQMLVDSGGPYQYGVPERDAFTGASAHNTVVVDAADEVSGNVAIDRKLNRAGYAFITGVHETSEAVQHRRTVLLVKPELVLVFDELISMDGARHRYDLLYHLPPDAAVQALGSTVVLTKGSVAMGLAVAAGEDVSLAIREGETDPLFGWVATGNAKREPAPVLDFGQEGATAWYVTAIVPATATDAFPPDLTAERTSNGFSIEVEDGRRHWQIELPDEGEPTIAP